MSKQTLVTAKREQDGKFALLLKSESAVQRDMRRETLRRKRQQRVVEDNAEWCKEMGFDASMAAEIFA